MENNTFTINEIERAADFYCSNCCLSCDECGLYDFINFELSYCLTKAVKKDEGDNR